jgi:hypothetical protein
MREIPWGCFRILGLSDKAAPNRKELHDRMTYQRGSRNPRPPDAFAFCLRYSA